VERRPAPFVLGFATVPRLRPTKETPLVLVIDDSEDNREVYAQFLLHVGWRVAIAVDGVEGLAQATALRPDAIVLDLGMPKMDGWEVAKRLKANTVTRRIPVLALTGHALDQSKQRAVAAGVDDYLVKPCLPADLVAAIRRHLK
jgi:two-component system cell cycle response regulator DivK